MFHHRDNGSFDLITSWRKKKKKTLALISLHSTNLVKINCRDHGETSR